MHMLVVWNLLGGVISASRVGGSDSRSSNQPTVLAQEGKAGSPLFVSNFASDVQLPGCENCSQNWEKMT